jgi:hypothetical protein
MATATVATARVSPGCPPARIEAEAFERQVHSDRLLRTRPWAPEWLDFIRGMRADGHRVVLVSLGRSARLQRQVDPDFVRRFHAQLQAEARQHRLEVWTFDAQKLPDADFGDGVHMSASGRAAFERWLAQQLAAEHAGQ